MTRPFTVFFSAPFVFLGTVLLAAAPTRQEARPGSPETRAELVPVPAPVLSDLEDAVQEQLRAALDSVASLRQGSGAPELGAAYGLAGQLHHVYGFQETAEACYRNALALTPEDFRWLYYLGRLHQKAGHLEQAESHYRRALVVKPNDGATLVHLGRILFEQNRPEEAETMFRDALTANGTEAAARAGLGQAALLRRDFRGAIEHFSVASKLVPQANRLHYSLGMAYRGLGDQHRAQEHLARSGAVGVAPKDPLEQALQELRRGERVHTLRGRTAFLHGHFTEAAREFDKAVSENPRSYRARVNLGSALAKLGELPRAVEQYEEALRLEPAGATAHFNLGQLHAQRGLYAEAIEHLEAATELQPWDAEAHFELGRLLRQTGAPVAALLHLERAIELDPRQENFYLDTASLLVRLGRFREALERLEEAHRRLPLEGLTMHALARVLAACPDERLRDGERALSFAARVYEAQPTPAHAQTVALALAELGRCEEAAKWQRRSIEPMEKNAVGSAPQARDILARYEAGSPCRPPGTAGK